MARVAFISTMSGAPWGGSEYLWSQTALYFAQSGVTVGINVFRWTEVPKQLTELEHVGCRIAYRERYLSIKQHIMRRLIRDSEYSWLDVFKPDLVVISQGSNLDGCGWMQACIKRGLKFIVIVHGGWPYQWPNFQCAQSYSKAAACFFISKANLELNKLQLAIPFTNAKIIKNPFNVNYDAKPPWPSTSPKYKLACVAALEAGGKGQDILFEVMNQDKWRNRCIEVTLFGNGPDRKRLQVLKQMLQLENIKFGGFISDVERIWASHHALVLASRAEGIPIALVEAMLCGRPCIVTDVGGNMELLEDNVSGFIASAPKKEYLDEAMERAWERKGEWQDIGRNAAYQVRKLIPPDPVKDFVKELRSYLDGGQG